MAEDKPTELKWTTDNGADITVTAERGKLYVTLETSDVAFEKQQAFIRRVDGVQKLDCGIQTDDNGERFNAFVPVPDRVDQLKALAKASKPTDEPLTFTVGEKTHRGGRTAQVLECDKDKHERTTEERELKDRVEERRGQIPDGYDLGDTIPVEEILDDVRTEGEREQDAIDEARETGDEVAVKEWSESCDGSVDECDIDHVRKVATPEGEIETRRAHTY